MTTGLKSIDNLPEKYLKMIDSVSDERNIRGVPWGRNQGVWIYLKEDFIDVESGMRQVHEMIVSKAVERLKLLCEYKTENGN